MTMDKADAAPIILNANKKSPNMLVQAVWIFWISYLVTEFSEPR